MKNQVYTTKRKQIYIKFKNPESIYLLDDFYTIKKDFPLVCAECGENLYIPVNISIQNNWTIEQPMGDCYRPFPLEKPDLIFRTKTKPMFIKVEKELSYNQVQALKEVPEIGYVDRYEFQLIIDSFSFEPIKHVCKEDRVIDSDKEEIRNLVCPCCLTASPEVITNIQGLTFTLSCEGCGFTTTQPSLPKLIEIWQTLEKVLIEPEEH